MSFKRRIEARTVRRLAIACQRLVNPPEVSGRQQLMEVMRDIGCVQIDPLRAVEQTQLLVLRSRLGDFDNSDLDALLYEERQLFEYWAHAASYVLMEDYPIFWRHMRDWAPGDRPWMKRAQAWMAENEEMRSYILAELEKNGPMAVREFHDESKTEWQSGGWTNGQTVRIMLNYLWEQGEIMVSQRKGLTKLWDLRERCLPEWTPRDDIDWLETVYRAAQKSLRALGVGTQRHIERHFTRNNYPDLDVVLRSLEDNGLIQEVEVFDAGEAWPGPWFIHSGNLELLNSIESGMWQDRTNILSPFDNLICDRDRTEQIFEFHFRIEIYVPAAKRQYGYYVMPILHGDRLIGRIDPKMDRKSKTLLVNNVYAEPEAPDGKETGKAVAGAIWDLAQFLGAGEVQYVGDIPKIWKSGMG